MFFTLAMFNILHNSQENIYIDQSENVMENDLEKISGGKDQKSGLAEIQLNAPLYSKKIRTVESKLVKPIDSCDHEVLQFYDANVKFQFINPVSIFDDSDEISLDSDCFFTSEDILKPI